MKPTDFKIGEIYKMAVASRSHVTKPYFVIIKDVGVDYIETYIPGNHSLRIDYPSGTWYYQTARMSKEKKSSIFCLVKQRHLPNSMIKQIITVLSALLVIGLFTLMAFAMYRFILYGFLIKNN